MCRMEDWGAFLSLSLQPQPSQNVEAEKKQKALRRRKRSRDHDCCALVLPTPSCFFNALRDSGGHDLSALVLSTTSCTFYSRYICSTLPRLSTSVSSDSDESVAADDPERPTSAQNSPPPQTSAWKEKVALLNGTPPVLLLRKQLYATDVSNNHTRFLFTKGDDDVKKSNDTGKKERGPKKLRDMLTEAEKEAARSEGGLPLILLNRRGEEHEGNKLKFWKSINCYVLLGNWPKFVSLNELEMNDVVEVYAFRVPLQAVASAPPSANGTLSAGPTEQTATLEQCSNSTPQAEPPGGWRLAMVMCSLVPPEVEETRQQESPESKKARRRLQQEELAKDTKKKAKLTDKADGAN